MNVYNLQNNLGAGSGWFKEPIRAIAPIQAPIVTRPVAVAPIAPTSIPYYDVRRKFQYTSEQIREMMDRSRAQKEEITDAQNNEGGDGVDFDLEQTADEQNATDKAIEDSAGGAWMPENGEEIEGPENEFAPLVMLAGLAWLLFN